LLETILPNTANRPSQKEIDRELNHQIEIPKGSKTSITSGQPQDRLF